MLLTEYINNTFYYSIYFFWLTSLVYRQRTRWNEVKQVLSEFLLWRPSMIHESQGQIPGMCVWQVHLIHNFVVSVLPFMVSGQQAWNLNVKFSQLFFSSSTNTHIHLQYIRTHPHTHRIKDCSQSTNEAEHLLSSGTLRGDMCTCQLVSVCVYEQETMCCMVAVVE